jgi:hypothetical protein
MSPGMRLAVRAALGLALAVLSVGAALGNDRHVAVLGAAEIVFALIYAWPRAPRWADAGLLGVMLIAVGAHALRGQVAGTPLASAVAILALWPRRSIRAQDPADAVALAVFQLRAGGSFPHAFHLRTARLYLQQLALPEALDRYIADLRHYASAKGASSKYHETITVAFLLLIRARLADAPADESFDAFLARNPDLASPACLKTFYSDAALDSPTARRHFVFPDRVAARPSGDARSGTASM